MSRLGQVSEYLRLEASPFCHKTANANLLFYYGEVNMNETMREAVKP